MNTNSKRNSICRGGSNASAWLWYAGVGVLCMLFFLIYQWTPLISDDLWFLLKAKDIPQGWERFQAALLTMHDRVYSDPLRLANLLCPPFLALWPKWVFNLVSTLCILAIMLECKAIVKLRAGSVRSWVMVAMIVVCLPWYDYFFIVMFSLNYIWTMALVCGVILMLLRADKQLSGISLAAGALLCFCAGWMHEGFGMPLAGAAVVVGYLRYRRGSLTKGYIWLTAALCLGAAMILLSPALWVRTNMEWKLAQYPLKEFVMQLGPGIGLSLLTLLLILPALLNRERRQRVFSACGGSDTIWLLSLFLFASWVIVLKFYNGPRTCCGIILADILLIMAAIPAYVRRVPARWLSISANLLIFILLSWHLGYAANAQRKILAEHNRVVELYERSPEGTIYCDITYPHADLSLFKTTIRELHERIPKQQFSFYYGGDSKPLVILPSALERLGTQNPEPTSRPGVWTMNGILLFEKGVEMPDGLIEVEDQYGNWQKSRYRRDEFRDSWGREWVMITPHAQVLDSALRIRDARF